MLTTIIAMFLFSDPQAKEKHISEIFNWLIIYWECE